MTKEKTVDDLLHFMRQVENPYWMIDIVERMRWIPVEERLPNPDDQILLSFENFDIPLVGHYEEDGDGGAFYVGDDLESCASAYLFVNAWMPLPKPYRPKGE